MVQAATGGHLNVVKFLHENRDEGCSYEAIENAAEGGHFGVAMEGAARNGCVELVKYLHDMGAEITAHVLTLAAWGGRLDVVQFLHENCIEGYLPQAMELATRCGNLNVVKYLHEVCGMKVTAFHVVDAADRGNLELLKYLCGQSGEMCMSQVVLRAVENMRVEVVRVLMKWYPETFVVINGAIEEEVRALRQTRGRMKMEYMMWVLRGVDLKGYHLKNTTAVN
ncbi:hypothetical protein BC829DRAFT_387730 [Chytridium lagenaria]|nr:hypothetical protein BC829DRAFT_387730 [Chytridium lagenaria]